MIALMLLIFSMSGYAQLDVTNLVLKNAGFDEGINFTASDNVRWRTSANDDAVNWGMHDIEGWNMTWASPQVSGWTGAAASFSYDTPSTINDVAPPAKNYAGTTTGGVVGFSSGWSVQVGYQQDVFLPAGSYTIDYVIYNRATTTRIVNMVGWVPDGSAETVSLKGDAATDIWEEDAINFVLPKYASGKIRVGFGSVSNQGSGYVGKVFVDYIKLTCVLNTDALQTLLDEANTLYGDGSGTDAAKLKAAIDAYTPVAGEPANSPTLFVAAVNLCKAVKEYKDTVANEVFFANALEELNGLMDEADQLLAEWTSNKFPTSAKNALEAVYLVIDGMFANNSFTAANIQGYIDQLRTAIESYKASALGKKIEYKFDIVNGNVVTNNADSKNYNATLFNEASVISMGKYKVLNLGNGSGYLDIGQSAGYIFPTIENYTISVYYRVDNNATITGAGNFLWSFSSSNACSQTVGQYVAYRLNAQRLMFTTSGYGSEAAGLEVATPTAAAEKGGWHNIVYRQTGNLGELYLDGDLKVSSDAIPMPSGSFTANLLYNWIGRSPYTSDVYLRNTLVYDFCLFNQAVPDPQIAAWAAVVPDLNNEYNYGSAGDFSELIALIAEYNTVLANAVTGEGVGEYLEMAKLDFQDAIAVAQGKVNENKASQFLIDEYIADLKAAYNAFLATAGSVIVYPASAGTSQYPFESGLYYIQVGNYFLTVPETGANNTYLQLRAYIDNPDKLNNNQVWNIQYNPVYSDISLDPPQALYSFVSDKTVWDTDGAFHLDELGRMKEGNTETAQSSDNSNWSWREHRIYFNGTAYSIVSHENGSATISRAIVFPNGTLNEQASMWNDKKFNFIFRSIDDVVDNLSSIHTPKIETGAAAKIYGARGEIIVSGANSGDRVAVYDISGRLIKTQYASSVENRINIVPGLYIVKVLGQTPAVSKVIVR